MHELAMAVCNAYVLKKNMENNLPLLFYATEEFSQQCQFHLYHSNADIWSEGDNFL